MSAHRLKRFFSLSCCYWKERDNRQIFDYKKTSMLRIGIHFFVFLFWIKTMPSTTEASSTTGSAVAHTAIAENVAVKSIVSTETQSRVSMENTQKMAVLLGRLGFFCFSLRIFVKKFRFFSNLRYNSSTNWRIFSSENWTHLRRSYIRHCQSRCRYPSSTTNLINRC